MRPPVGRRDRAPMDVEADGRLQHVGRGDVDGLREPVEERDQPFVLRQRHEDRTQVVIRLEQPLDRHRPLGDEELVALASLPGGDVGEIDVVGQPWVGRILDRDQHRDQCCRSLGAPP